MPRRSSDLTLLPKLVHVVGDERDDGDEEDDRQRAASTDVELDEGLRVHLVGDDLRAEVAVRHRSDDVEDLQHGDHDRGPDHDERRPDHGDGHPAEQLPAGRTIEFAGLDVPARARIEVSARPLRELNRVDALLDRDAGDAGETPVCDSGWTC